MDTPNAPGTGISSSPPGADTQSSALADTNKQLGRLLAGIAQGRREDFAEFYRLTSRRVFGMARRVLVDPGLSEDTTQEVFLQVWQNAAKFDPAAGSPMAWLMTISHRRAIDKVRSVQSATDREAKVFAQSHEVEHDAVAEEVGGKLEAEQVVRCLGTLTAAQQESVRLAYYGGLTYREVAEHLNTAIPTIKSRIRDGLIRLKSCLDVA